MSLFFPRVHSELSGQDETTSDFMADYRDYEALVKHPAVQAKYVIVKEGSIYYALPCFSGGTKYSRTSLSTLLNTDVFPALTAARVWQEKVVVKGDCEITDTILIPSYTIFELQGKITIPNSSAVSDTAFLTVNIKPLITNDDHAGGNTAITIQGGVVDGNGDTQPTANWANIWLENTTHSKIEDTSSVDSAYTLDTSAPLFARAYCYLLTNCSDIVINRCYGAHSGYEVLGIRNANNDVKVTNSYFEDGVVHVAQVADGWWSGPGVTYNIRVDNSSFIGTDEDTFTIHGGRNVRISHCRHETTSATGTSTMKFIGGASNIWVTDSELKGARGDVIRVGEIAGDALDSIHIIGNTIQSTTGGANEDAISVGATDVASISNLHIKNNVITTVGASSAPIRIQAVTPSKVHISGNKLSVAGVSRCINCESGMVNSKITDNTAVGNAGAAAFYLDDVTYSIIANNSISAGSYGIYEVAGSDNNLIISNDVSGIATATQRITKAGASTKIRDNIGYVTENKGSSTGTGVEQTIAHGCTFTPTVANLFLSESDTATLALARPTKATDATNIYVIATNGAVYNWEVKL